MTQFVEDPSSLLDYSVDWSAWLQSGETITISQWTVQSPLTSFNPQIQGGRVTVWVSGGSAGQSLSVTNHIQTSAGRQDSRSFTIWFQAR